MRNVVVERLLFLLGLTCLTFGPHSPKPQTFGLIRCYDVVAALFGLNLFGSGLSLAV